MFKIIKIENKIIAYFHNGVIMEKDNCSDDDFMQIRNINDEKELCEWFLSDKDKEALKIINEVNNSNLLKCVNDKICWPEISELSMPEELVSEILNAEKEGDEVKLLTYKNFWTLMCLNTDPVCRKKLFNFLKIHGLTIEKHGFFVAYRNVDKTKEEGVYTDHHTGTFRIKIGEMVTIDRRDCDSNSNIECSRGLHVAGKNWLTRNYYGTQGLVCLVNPADVVAVPGNSEYGKLRCCAYLPIDLLEYNYDDKPIEFPKEDGFDCSYVNKVIYEGLMGTESDTTYKIVIPQNPSLNKDSIQNRLFDIALQAIKDRNS